jgi:molybdate transport system substrate-binding protein
MKLNTMLSFLLVFAFVVSGCASPAASTAAPTAQAVTLKVFAPSTMTDAAKELSAAFEANNPGVTVIVEFGHSPTQRLQFTEGATGDVFITAAQKDMDDAITDKTVVEGTNKVFATNMLIVILSPKNTPGLDSLEGIAGEGVKLLIANEDVPVGKATMSVIDKLDKQFGNGFKDKLNANVVSKEPGVKPIVSKIKLDEADAGIVFVSDASTAPDLKTITIPSELNMVSKLNIAPLAASEQPTIAAAFSAYLVSAEGQAILAKWGFMAAK